MKKMLLAAATFACVALGSTAALAQDKPAAADATPDRWRDRPFAIWGQGGVGTPLGLVGGMLEWSPHRMVAIGAGAGFDFAGVQYGVMPRLRLILAESVAFHMGLGASGGRWKKFCFLSGCSDMDYRVVDNAVRANIEAGFEGRTEQGMTWR